METNPLTRRLHEWLATELATKSPRTLQTYQEAVRKLWTLLDPPHLLANISSADVKRLYANWTGSKNALAHYDRVWRAIFGRVERYGKDALALDKEWSSPWKDVERVRADVEEKVALSEEQIEWVMEVYSGEGEFRKKTFMHLLCNSGLRVSEALDVAEGRVYPGSVAVRTKGGRTRLVFVPAHVTEMLRSLLVERDGRYFPWSRSQAYKVVREAGERVGLEGLHPHQLRHSYASIMLNVKQAPLKFVQEQLGHRDVKTTMRYVHVTAAQKAEMAERFAL